MLKHLLLTLTDPDGTLRIEVRITEDELNAFFYTPGDSEGSPSVQKMIEMQDCVRWVESLNELGIEDWRERYEEADGGGSFDAAWHLAWENSEGVRGESSGSGAYPESWSQLIALVDELLPEIELIPGNAIDAFELRFLGPDADGNIHYRETLTIDRAESKLVYCIEQDPSCRILHECVLPGAASVLLENLRQLLDQMDLASNQDRNLDGPTAVMTITRHHGGTEKFQWRYERGGLPAGWARLMNEITSFILFGRVFGDLFDADVFNHGAFEGEYIYASVEFEEDGNTYYYRTESDDYYPGDLVMVPVGTELEPKVGRIVSIEYYKPEDAPYPPERTKFILSHCDDVPGSDTDTKGFS